MKAYFNNGLGYRHINDASEAEPGEHVFNDIVSPDELNAVFPGFAAAASASAKADHRVSVVAQLAALDVFLPRALEDYWIASGFDTTKLPQAQQDRLHLKESLRAELAT